MAVYVDPLMEWGGSKTFPWKHSCHLIADKPEELHRFAAQIGLKKAWAQTDGLLHYDLTANKRKQAVRNGAIEITLAQLAKRIKRNEERQTRN